MSKTVSLGVIGCGKRTESLIRKLRPDNSSIRLVAVCDPLPERRERFRTEFNLDLALYDDEDAFFQHSGLEWVMIGSWNVHHRRHVEKALQIEYFLRKAAVHHISGQRGSLVACLCVELSRHDRVYAPLFSSLS